MEKTFQTWLLAAGVATLWTATVEASAAVIAVTDVSLTKGTDYSNNRAGCTARSFVPGFSSTLLTNGGFDGFDCGLNVPTTTVNPGTVAVNPGPGLTIKLGEAALNERALITFGTFPVGDGRGLGFLDMTLNFNAGGQTLTFIGTADFFQGGTAAAGDAALIATCENLATAGTLTQCVDDPSLDFRVIFDGPKTVTVGADTFAFSVNPLSFSNRQAPVNIAAVATVTSSTPSPIPEPSILALVGVGAASLLRRRNQSTL